MNQTRIFFTVPLMVSILLSGCVPAATPANTPTPGTAAQNIVDLVGRGAITFKITSGGINELGLDIQNTTDQALHIDIPAGIYFVNLDSKSQNMVVRHPASASIQPNGQADIQLEAACANIHLTEPTQENTFTIQRTPEPPELTEVIDKLNSAKVDYPVEQAAIWIVTDDATFDELGMLVEGSRFGASTINEKDAVRAMMLVDEAGLYIRNYAIWGDRTQLIGKVTEPDLSAWLDNQVATQAVEDATQMVEYATQTAQMATEMARETQTAQAVPTPTLAEIRQFATTATASSQYSATGWSAMQSVGAPDAIPCDNDPKAWKSLDEAGKDWLLLTYAQPVIPTQIVIHQSFQAGAVSLVEVLDEVGKATTVYTATPAILSQCPYNLEIEVKNVHSLVRSVRITIDQTNHNGRNLIDAVQLIGLSR
jgi:hypothetical protein